MGKKSEALDRISSIQNEVANSAKEMSESLSEVSPSLGAIVMTASAAITTGMECCRQVIYGKYDDDDLTDRQIADAMLSAVMITSVIASLGA